ncbi:MAG: FGGY-family carbohydrate kinase [Galactobacter sp.]
MSAETVAAGRASLGIEFGSTRIKACLIGENHEVLASGFHDWENDLVDGLWTYSWPAVEAGARAAFADLASSVQETYGVPLTKLRAVAVSAMMHGYLPLDADRELLVPFRTWRNTNTQEAAAALTQVLGVNIPLRWSVAHLGQAVLNGEDHVREIASFTTLAGLVHRKLTGSTVLGIGDASGMFPCDPQTRDYDEDRLALADAWFAEAGFTTPLRDLLPPVGVAGADAGVLTEDGAAWLDPTGGLAAGAPAAPAEGDAGTGMVATNAVAPRTGNVSVGTSVFAMVVLEGALPSVHHEIDLVTTPSGDAVAMVHCNNGASELAAWAGLLGRFADALGAPAAADDVFAALLRAAMDGEADAGGVLAYNQLSGEPVLGLEAGRPMVLRTPGSRLTLANFARAQLHGVFASLAVGMRVLSADGVRIDTLQGHGGLFRTSGPAQSVLAAAVDAPVAVTDTAGEGGAWGAAILAAFRAAQVETSVPDGAVADLAGYLTRAVFADSNTTVVHPDPDLVAGYTTYLARYEAALPAERAAVEAL